MICLPAGLAIPKPAGGGGGGTHEYWRLYIDDTINIGASGGYTGVNKLEMRASIGGSDQCVGGTASANAVGFGYAASRAFTFPVGTGTGWLNNGSGVPAWIKYQFPAPVSVAEIMVCASDQSGLGGAIKDGRLQWSDDDSAWTDAITIPTQSAWTALEIRTFS